MQLFQNFGNCFGNFFNILVTLLQLFQNFANYFQQFLITIFVRFGNFFQGFKYNILIKNNNTIRTNLNPLKILIYNSIEILSRCFNISLGVVCSLPWSPRGRAVKTLAANAGGRGFESHRGQNSFFTIYSILIEWNVKNYFVKLI